MHWCSRFSSFCFLNSNGYQLEHSQADVLAGAGEADEYTIRAAGHSEGFAAFLRKHAQRFVFGHIGYGFTEQTMQVNLQPTPADDFSRLSFFIPLHTVKVENGAATIYATTQPEALALFQTISSILIRTVEHSELGFIQPFEPVISKKEYLHTVDRLLQHIHRGDCYEINYCQQFVAEATSNANPVLLYEILDQQSPNPFGGLYRRNHNWLLCASPERFVQRHGSQLLSQPIKGTSKRNSQEASGTETERKKLTASEKDRAENVMIVDLVRNDLSRVCKPGSVQVKELFGIYTFPQVHQMISTVTGTLRDGIGLSDIIRHCFPMGSMTGAPKKRVVELIDQYETTPRGIYSGALGYVAPDGNFDFNVVIRSLVYNQSANRFHFHAGGGITAYSVPEKEYEECLLKAATILNLSQ